jgi:hypothetical protein
MTVTTFGETRNNDLYLDSSGNLAVVTGLMAVLTLCRAAMQTQFGECVLDLTRGVPTDATVWSSWLPAQFEAASRALLATIAGVVSVKSFTITRAAHVMHYTAEIETIYGTCAING